MKNGGDRLRITNTCTVVIGSLLMKARKIVEYKSVWKDLCQVFLERDSSWFYLMEGCLEVCRRFQDHEWSEGVGGEADQGKGQAHSLNDSDISGDGVALSSLLGLFGFKC